MKARRIFGLRTMGSLCLFLLPTIFLIVIATQRGGNTAPSVTTIRATVMTSLAELTAAPRTMLTNLDIGRMNLLCTEGLPGSKRIAVEEQMKQLDEWATRISAETTSPEGQWTEGSRDCCPTTPPARRASG